jgi:NAD(P)-dependent dehydrogenase (short-subunit alcohol dehydrogenase family)
MAQTVIISGGTKGLGRASVKKWLSEGWAVATCARDESELAHLETECASELLLTHALDLSDPVAVRGFAERAIGHFGQVDVLINNASILGPRVEISDYDEATWRKVIEINLNGSFFLAKSVLPHMLSRREGIVVNVSSGAGVKGKACWGAYAASKFAVEGFTQVLRDEVRDRGIRVHAFDPGAMQTEMRAAAYPEEDPKQHPTPEVVARVLFDVIAVYEPQLARLVASEYL